MLMPIQKEWNWNVESKWIFQRLKIHFSKYGVEKACSNEPIKYIELDAISISMHRKLPAQLVKFRRMYYFGAVFFIFYHFTCYHYILHILNHSHDSLNIKTPSRFYCAMRHSNRAHNSTLSSVWILSMHDFRKIPKHLLVMCSIHSTSRRECKPFSLPMLSSSDCIQSSCA